MRVNEFIDLILTDWYSELERSRFLSELVELDGQSRGVICGFGGVWFRLRRVRLLRIRAERGTSCVVMQRRDFLKASTLATLSGIALQKLFWAKAAGQGEKVRRIGLQLYSVRKELEIDFEGTLSKVAAIGYREVEFAGYFGHHPGKIRTLLRRYQLDSPSSHISTEALLGDWSKALDTAMTLGNRYLICAFLPPGERRSLDDYTRWAEVFNRCGEVSRQVGVQFGYHNHAFEFEPLQGKLPYRTLLEETDPNLVQMEMDLYWISKANQDPIEYFTEFSGRFSLLHVKDMDDTPRHFFTEVGRGIIDFKRIFAHRQEAGVKHFFVEQDVSSGSALTSAQASFNYLERMEF